MVFMRGAGFGNPASVVGWRFGISVALKSRNTEPRLRGRILLRNLTRGDIQQTVSEGICLLV